MLAQLLFVGSDVIDQLDSANSDGDFAGVVTQAKALGSETYKTLMTIAIFGGVIMLILAFLIYMASGSAKSKDAAKTKIIWVLVGIALSVMATAIVALVYQFGTGL